MSISDRQPPYGGSGAAGTPPDMGTFPGDEPRRDPGSAFRDEAREAAGHAKEATRSTMSYVRRRTEEEVGRRKEEAARRLHDVAGAIREAGHRLQDHDENRLGGFADTAARGVERVSEYVRDKELTDLIHDAERLARRNPELFLGASFVVGVALARFLKSSSERSLDIEEEEEPWDELYGSEPFESEPYRGVPPRSFGDGPAREGVMPPPEPPIGI